MSLLIQCQRELGLETKTNCERTSFSILEKFENEPASKLSGSKRRCVDEEVLSDESTRDSFFSGKAKQGAESKTEGRAAHSSKSHLFEASNKSPTAHPCNSNKGSSESTCVGDKCHKEGKCATISCAGIKGKREQATVGSGRSERGAKATTTANTGAPAKRRVGCKSSETSPTKGGTVKRARRAASGAENPKGNDENSNSVPTKRTLSSSSSSSSSSSTTAGPHSQEADSLTLGGDDSDCNDSSLLWDVLAMAGLGGRTDVTPPCAYECLRLRQTNPSYFVVGTVMLPAGAAYNFPVVQDALISYRTAELEVTGIHSSLYNEKKVKKRPTHGSKDDDDLFDDEVPLVRSTSSSSMIIEDGKKIGQLFVKINMFTGPAPASGGKRPFDAVTVTFHRKNSIKIAGLKGGNEQLARERSHLVISSLCRRIQERHDSHRDVLELERHGHAPSWKFELSAVSIRQWASFPGLFAGNSNFKSIFLNMADGQIGRVEENSNKALRCKTNDGTLQIQRTGLMQVLASIEEPARFASRFCWILYQLHLSERVFPDMGEEYEDYDDSVFFGTQRAPDSCDEAPRTSDEEMADQDSTITSIMPRPRESMMVKAN